MKLIYSDNNVLNDISTNVSNYHSGADAFTFEAANDFFYLGQRFAFNQFYMKFSALNTASSTMSLSYWDGKEWRSAVDIEDGTSGFTADGKVMFVPDKQYGWMKEDTVRNSGVEEITGLGDVTIYDRYWLRVSFDNDLDADTAIQWIGRLFASDDDLYGEYPMFNNTALKTAIEAGKTTYEEQRLRATEVCIDNLITKGIITNGNQLLNAEILKTPIVSKTAEIIFTMLGFDEYEDDRKRARNEYTSRLNKDIFNVDINDNALLDDRETNVRPRLNKDIFNVDINDNALLDDRETNVRQGRMWR